MIKDSGSRREFASGAVRDIQEGKGRCDLMPLFNVAHFLSRDAVLCAIAEYVETGGIQSLYIALENFVLKLDTDKPTLMLEAAIHYEEGRCKYGERNWQKGLPLHCYIDSGVRHYLKWLRGDDDERHDRAFCWNILGAIWTHENKPELREYPYVLEGNEND